MTHLLDNPIWNAMVSGNSRLAKGSDLVKYFYRDVAPFAALKELDEESLHLLYDIFPAEEAAVLITADNLAIPGQWETVHQANLFQMTGVNLKHKKTEQEIVELTIADVPQMLALTQLTNPGPFYQRTIEFGRYRGVKQAGQLVAMAGQRLHVEQHIEISAVCTHPDHLGKGYASALLLDVAGIIEETGKIPFLHVKDDNETAISVYKKLGFEIRNELKVKVIQKRV